MNLTRAIENLKAMRVDAGMVPAEEYTDTIDIATEALELLTDEIKFRVDKHFEERRSRGGTKRS